MEFLPKMDAKAISWAMNAIVMVFGNFNRIEVWRDRIEALLKPGKKIPDGEIGELITATMFFVFLFMKPGHPEFSEWEDRAKKILETSGNLHIRTQILFALNNYYCFRGDLPAARLIFDREKRMLHSVPHSPIFDLKLILLETTYHRNRGEFEKSVKTAAQGLEFSKKTGVQIMDFMFLGQAAWAYLDWGDPCSAETYLEQMKKTFETRTSLEISFYHHLEAKKYRLQGNLAMAGVQSVLSLKVSKDDCFFITTFLSALQNAVISHDLNRPKEAEKRLKETKMIAELDKNPYALFSWYIIKSYIMFGNKREKEGTRALNNAMTIGAAHKFKTFVPLYADIITKLCVIALDQGIEAEYVRTLIANLDLVPNVPPVHIENWPWALKVYTLGRFTLLKDGESFQSKGKAQKKPLEMLKAIISLGGRNIHFSKISDLLWPQKDGDVAQKSLHTTLFRLRKLLGRDDLLIIEDGTITLNNTLCWVDLWSFERLLSEAGQLKQAGDTGKALPLIKQAIHSYQGSFLSHYEDLSWTGQCREKARMKFLGNVSFLAGHYGTQERWQEAAGCYIRALEEDDLSEKFYEGLMTSYKNLNDRSGFIKTYTRCKKNLYDKLKIEPCQEIRVLYQSLMK